MEEFIPLDDVGRLHSVFRAMDVAVTLCDVSILGGMHCSAHTHHASVRDGLGVWFCFQVLLPPNPTSLILRETLNPNKRFFS